MAEEDREMRRTESPEGHLHPRKFQKRKDFKEDKKGGRRIKKSERSEAKRSEESGRLERRPSITPQDIDHLLDEAQKEAESICESSTRWRLESSAEGEEFVAKKDDGSQMSDSQFVEEFGEQGMDGSEKIREDHSQKAREELQGRVRERLAGLSSGSTVGDLGAMVADVLNMLEPISHHCRPRSTTRKFDLFPLPVPGLCQPGVGQAPFLQALVMCLNSLHSGGEPRHGATLTPAARGVLKRLEDVVQGSHILKEQLPDLDFSTFFTFKSLDYTGEEVRLALPISWASIEASLPPEAGSLDIREFCTGGILHFINNIDETILEDDLQLPPKNPSVMIKDAEWEKVARGLVDRGLCTVVSQDELFHIGSLPLLNGLFSVGKDEMKGTIPVTRLIMNLKPWNSISRSLAAEVGTLPSVTQLGAIYLHDHDVLTTSSEDLRCFFYLFRVPQAWIKYMGFNKEIPASMVPLGGEGKRWFLAGTVLPMGYLNSVGVAQHIHRVVVQRALGSVKGLGQSAQEIRRDRIFSTCPNLYRVYLDNFDQLQKVDRETATLISGSPSELVQQVRECYAEMQLPRHPKKTVEQSLSAEVQGAWVDGEQGTITAKPSKVAKYVRLALELVGRGKASQRELQVVGGGFVYIAMFKRPLLSSLNQIWRSIVEGNGESPHVRHTIRREVLVELVRFIGLIPLSFINIRGTFDEEVTASDASSSGGGFCRSTGVTPYGHSAGLSNVRGDIPEEESYTQILSIGLFDGIGALRVALDALGAPVAGHISVEKNAEARRVLEANFPDSECVEDIEMVTEDLVKTWALKFSMVGLVILGSGPPCQGVSGLNSDRKGALRDLRSRLFQHVPRVEGLCRKCFPWAQVHSLTENVASMDGSDCQVMNDSFNSQPWFIDADGISLAHRPRLYWVSWELMEHQGVEIYWGSNGKLPICGQVILKGEVSEKHFLEPGWHMKGDKRLPTFTTSRPSSRPLRRPAGIADCDEEELTRWRDHAHRFPPYQYKRTHCLEDRQGNLRVPNIKEREVILGFPPNYTRQCLKKSEHGKVHHEDCRLSLVGNSWSVGVVTWLLSQLLHPLGIIQFHSVADIVTKLTPGQAPDLQSLLLRPPMAQSTKTLTPNSKLISKLSGLVSLKGEDLLLQGTSEVPVKYHRLRSGVPAKLWRWQAVAGWKWNGDPEHINVLEARAVLTTMKWRVTQRKQLNLRCVHLVDSLVCLHSLTRGRSSSRKMRRTMMRISAYLLASGLQPIWAYIDTKDNPADRPSRWAVKKQWVKH